MIPSPSNIPLSLYIHIPWCVKKCPYCDFNSHEKHSDFDEGIYVDALIQDLQNETPYIGNRAISSIFFGGGTPSLFSAKAIQRILSAVSETTGVADNAEITLEANPGTFEQEKFSAYRSSGVNRLSIGIQSFNQSHLTKLGRIHDDNQALAAVSTAKRAGFDNINIDLMFGLAGQSIDESVLDITTACETGVNHISHYQLTIEPNTYFNKFPPLLPELDYISDMQNACQKILSAHNYLQYEVSAFSKENEQSKHNTNYWLFGDYIGIGAGAHGKLTHPDSGEITRRWKRKQPADYIKHALLDEALSGSERIDKKDLIFEFLMNSLRLKDGFQLDIFEQRTGLNRAVLIEACQAIDSSLLNIRTDNISTSDKGFRFLNDLLEQFL